MILFPAIDLKDGVCVRLYKGDMAQATVFNDNPAHQAQQFEAMGFSWIHVVDLNGAFAGHSMNGECVEKICRSVKVPVQLGGGIRSLEHIEFWLEKGVTRVILGTVAVKNPDLVREACRQFPGKIVVGIDARDGYVATEGWAETSDVDVLTLAQKFEDCGVSALIYTDISRDGTLSGVNIDSTLALAHAVRIPVIASGGLSGPDDLRALVSQGNSKIAGVISGRALYDGRLNAREALDILGAAA